MADVAVVVLTFNEEVNLRPALESVAGWAREVFVVDSFSTDRTVDIALASASQGVRVVQHAFQDYSSQWAWAITRLPIVANWVLKLDADERLTPGFKAEVNTLITRAPESTSGIAFRRQLVFQGRGLRFGGHLENFDTRMWRRGSARIEDRPVNEHILVEGDVAYLTSFVLHSSAKDLSDWLDKHNRYSSMESRCALEGNLTGDVQPRPFGRPEERRMWLRRLRLRMPFRNVLYFLYRTVLRAGFLDGRAGITYAFLHASFLYWIDLKVAETKRTKEPPAVLWPRRGQAHPVVAASELQRLVDS